MGFFDRFKGKRKNAPETPAENGKGAQKASGAAQGPPPGPDADTFGLLLLGKETGWTAVVNAVEKRFGPEARVSVDNSHPNAPAMTFQLEGFAFFCSYLAMPHPAEVCDLSAAQALATEEERKALLGHRAFLVLAQKGGGTSLEAKRRVCRLFTRAAAALMELDGAAGVYVNAAELLLSRRVYLQLAGRLEENFQDPDEFPLPLWVSIRDGQKGEHQLLGTWGLNMFGFPELWFLNASAGREELFKRLCILAQAEITGRDTYRDGDTIQFTPGVTSTFQALHGALFIVEEH